MSGTCGVATLKRDFGRGLLVLVAALAGGALAWTGEAHAGSLCGDGNPPPQRPSVSDPNLGAGAPGSSGPSAPSGGGSTTGGGNSPPPGGGSGGSTSGASDMSGSTSGSATSGTASARSSAGTSASGATTRGARVVRGAGSAAASSPGAGTPVSRGAQPSGFGAGSAEIARTRSGRAVFGGSLAGAPETARRDGKAARLWPAGSQRGDEAAPSLAPAGAGPALEPLSRPELVIAMGMLGFGLAAMLGGFVVATHRRRRPVPVEAAPRAGAPDGVPDRSTPGDA